ncbi:MAG: zinc metallopeptidase [Bacilli bacterium]|nr:zinc metallopeptidase [Bacilli bacterium]
MGYLTLGYENGYTILLGIIGFVIVLYAQSKVSKAFRNYRKVKINSDLTGFEVARQILDANGLSNVHIVEIKGELTDHYDPTRKVLRLSKDIFHGTSIASTAVAAHEVGHAIQDKEGYIYMKIRAALVPVVNFVSYAGYFVLFISIFFGAMAYFKIGIIIVLATIIFQLITLPVEFDASKRANEQLKKLRLIEIYEEKHIKDMLSAAAFTYVASLVSSLLSLLRLILMAQDRD